MPLSFNSNYLSSAKNYGCLYRRLSHVVPAMRFTVPGTGAHTSPSFIDAASYFRLGTVVGFGPGRERFEDTDRFFKNYIFHPKGNTKTYQGRRIKTPKLK